VCLDGRMRRGEYRKFKIIGASGHRGIGPSEDLILDDFASMREVVLLRQSRGGLERGRLSWSPLRIHPCRVAGEVAQRRPPSPPNPGRSAGQGQERPSWNRATDLAIRRDRVSSVFRPRRRGRAGADCCTGARRTRPRSDRRRPPPAVRRDRHLAQRRVRSRSTSIVAAAARRPGAPRSPRGETRRRRPRSCSDT
jgi:hypothetical protein